MSIEIRDLSKRFGSFTALEEVSLTVATGELVTLLGPSGSGKTTLLRIMAGLEAPDAGAVLFHGEEATHRDPRERGVGFVFQHYALFRHMTVFENVAFGLRVRPRRERPAETIIAGRVRELLSLVQLEWVADRRPAQLSGGQRQRVALARALAVEPKVLLLDEPFGALDAQVRKELRRWLRRLHDEMSITTVFVTHDQEEALEVADRVVLMNRGRIEQAGSPSEVYEHPANPFVCNFLGTVNIFHSRVGQGKAIIGGEEFELSGPPGTGDTAALAYVRPHDVVVDRVRGGGGALRAVVQEIHLTGPSVRLVLMPEGQGDPIEAELTRERWSQLLLRKGEEVFATPRNLRIFTEDYSI